ncbi:MAG: succinylglutamate desuccinylase/aspartoacylase family protein [Bauldia litoralis]
MSDHTPATLSVQVIHGRRDGPTMFISAAVHGDEIIGVEIVRRLVGAPPLRRIAGTLLLIPIVNAFGFIGQSRYLPDRRDLNRSFPGSAKGSLAGRLADLFLTQIVSRCDYGIDLHSAAIHRENLPQIRIDLRDTRIRPLAEAFAPPVIVNSALRDGSLRHAASEAGVPVMVFEAGEGLRFDEFAVRVGVKGVLRVMNHLGMIGKGGFQTGVRPAPIARKSAWTRAVEGGILRTKRKIGDVVRENEVVGVISDPFGDWEAEVTAGDEGLIIGRTNLPVVNQGDALFHIATLPKAEIAGAAVSGQDEVAESDPLFDEDEIM